MAITLLEMMLQAHLVTPAQCDEALQNRVFFGGKIGTNLIELGFVTEEDLALFLSRKLGVPYVPPKRLLNLSNDVVKLIPRDLALKYQVIPLSLEKRRLQIAMADPADLRALDDISFITGHIVKPLITPEIRLNQALSQYYQVRMDDRLRQIIDRMGPPKDLPEPSPEPAVTPEPFRPDSAARTEGVPQVEKEEAPPEPGETVPQASVEAGQPDVDGGSPISDDSSPADFAPEIEQEDHEEPTEIPDAWEVPFAEGELTEPEKLVVEPGTGGRDWPQLDEIDLEPMEENQFGSLAGGSLEQTVETENPEPKSADVPAKEVPPSSPGVEADEIEELVEADIVEEEPLRVLIEPVTRDPVSRALARAADRDEIADILIDHLGQSFGKVALFVARQTYAAGWQAVREGVHIPDFSNLRIPLSRPSVLKSVAQGKSYFLGSLPETPLNGRILSALGGNGARQTLVMPLFIAGRVVILVYLEGGRAGLESRINDLQRLMKKTSLAFEILIARDKILMT